MKGSRWESISAPNGCGKHCLGKGWMNILPTGANAYTWSCIPAVTNLHFTRMVFIYIQEVIKISHCFKRYEEALRHQVSLCCYHLHLHYIARHHSLPHRYPGISLRCCWTLTEFERGVMLLAKKGTRLVQSLVSHPSYHHRGVL